MHVRNRSSIRMLNCRTPFVCCWRNFANIVAIAIPIAIAIATVKHTRRETCPALRRHHHQHTQPPPSARCALLPRSSCQPSRKHAAGASVSRGSSCNHIENASAISRAWHVCVAARCCISNIQARRVCSEGGAGESP